MPDRPGDRGQQQAADRLHARFAEVLTYRQGWTALDYADKALVVALPFVTAARAEEAARWQAKIEALAAQMRTEADDFAGRVNGYFYADRLRAVLDGGS